jgi:hypothetical protein
MNLSSPLGAKLGRPGLGGPGRDLPHRKRYPKGPPVVYDGAAPRIKRGVKLAAGGYDALVLAK